jgi:transglutaminase-like putative cysteine protease
MHLPIKRIPLSNQPDHIAILEVLEGLRERYSRSPYVWQIALKLIGRTGNNAELEHLNKLSQFVREKMIYVKDPQGAEYVTAPDVLLHRIATQGYAQGDCDDHVLLLNSLLGAVGIEARFAGAMLPTSTKWNHVITQARIKGKWYEVDTCSKKGTRINYDKVLTIR